MVTSSTGPRRGAPGVPPILGIVVTPAGVGIPRASGHGAADRVQRPEQAPGGARRARPGRRPPACGRM